MAKIVSAGKAFVMDADLFDEFEDLDDEVVFEQAKAKRLMVKERDIREGRRVNGRGRPSVYDLEVEGA